MNEWKKLKLKTNDWQNIYILLDLIENMDLVKMNIGYFQNQSLDFYFYMRKKNRK